MIGRMSSMQLHQGSLDVILDAQARLQRTQEELASGKRILNPSDDPSATAQIAEIRSSLVRTETYQRNLNYASSQLANIESKIASVEDGVLRIKNLLLQSANATHSIGDRQSMAREMAEIRDHLLSVANSQDSNGDYIFAGSKTVDAPYQRQAGEMTYLGDEVTRVINVAPGLTVSTQLTGEKIFGSNDPATVDIFSVLDAAILAVENNDQAAINAAMSLVDDGAEQIYQARTEIGVRMNRVEDQFSLNENFNLRLRETLSGLEDLDYAEAITKMNLQMVALEAAQKAYTKTQGLSLFNYL